MKAETTSRFAPPPPFTSQDEGVLGRALSAPLSILWDITYACNLRCPHCLTGSGKAAADELNREEALAILERLSQMRIFSITFCGGEPVLCPHLFEVIQAAVSRGMEVNLDTNGLLVNEKLADKLAAVGITAVQVSLDGTEETHDSFRGRKGSFAAAVRTVRLMVSRGFRVSVAPVLTSVTHQDLEYVVNLAADLGASGFKPSLFLPTGRGREHDQGLRLSPEEARADFQRLRWLQKQFNGRLHIAVEGSYPNLDVAAGRQGPMGERFAGAPVGCPAGVTQLVIAANGKVYACPFLYDFPAGDLRKESLPQIWRHARIFKVFRNMTKGQLQGQCRVCSYSPEHCSGGCRAAAYSLTGNLYGQDPLCWCTSPAEGCERSREWLSLSNPTGDGSRTAFSG